MRVKAKNSGFTLLEIIIVIIIIGVLASLALPRLFATVEYSRSAEALSAIASIRGSLERCYLQQSGDFAGCVFVSGGTGNTLDLEDPATSPNAHFTYSVTTITAGGGTEDWGYTVLATRNTHEGGDTDSAIIYVMDNSSVEKCGCEAFSAVGNCGTTASAACP